MTDAQLQRQLQRRLQRRVRLTDKIDYSRVFKQAEKSSDTYFTVLARTNDKDRARLGLAISRKVARSAVARNRIKRLIRESFRLQQTHLPAVDIVVIGRGKLAKQDNATLHQSLQRHWQRVAKLCVKP